MANAVLGEGGGNNVSRNVTLVIDALHGGGAERVAATMANQWTDQGDRVTLVTLDTVASDVYPVHPQVERIGLGLMRFSPNAWHAGWNNAHRIRALRQVIRDVPADCVVSVTDQMNVLTLLASQRLHAQVVIAEHSDPRHQRMHAAWERLRSWTYPRCAAAVVLSDAVAQYVRTLVDDRPVYVIPNGIGRPSVTTANVAQRDERMVVAMGRLSPEKGFDLLIDAFARLAAPHADWRLAIAGEGPERDSLQRQIDERGLQQQVQLVGWVNDPERFLVQRAVRDVVTLRRLPGGLAGGDGLWPARGQLRLRQRSAGDRSTRCGWRVGCGRRYGCLGAGHRTTDGRSCYSPTARYAGRRCGRAIQPGSVSAAVDGSPRCMPLVGAHRQILMSLPH